MLRLGEVTEENWLEAAALRLDEGQRGYAAPPMGILARGYLYRNCNARVWTIELDGRIVGLAMTREMYDEPAGYELQQLLVDREHQNKGVGTRALALVFEKLRGEGHYPTVEVCVKKDDKAALRLYEKAGFTDTGYIDENVPDALNLIYRL